MSVAALRHGDDRVSVEALLARLHALAGERQALRVRGAAGPSLEVNRLALVRTQWELSYALIRRHLPPAAARDAA